MRHAPRTPSERAVAGSRPADHRSRAQARRDALLEAEVRQLLRAIGPFGVLGRDSLARACHAHLWRSGRFEDALHAAVRQGRLRPLGFGFYGARRPPAREDEGRERKTEMT
jgi:hypothetical protein